MSNDLSFQTELSAYLTDPKKVTFSSPVLDSALRYAMSICSSHIEFSSPEVKTSKVLFVDGKATLPTDGEIVGISSIKDKDGKCLTPIMVTSQAALYAKFDLCGAPDTLSYMLAGNTILLGCSSGAQVYNISAVIKGESSDTSSFVTKRVISKYHHIIVEFMLSYLLGIQFESVSARSESQVHFERGMNFLKLISPVNKGVVANAS